MANFFFKILKAMISIDIYGYKVELQYKGWKTKNTLLGLCCTIATLVIMGLYFGF